MYVFIFVFFQGAEGVGVGLGCVVLCFVLGWDQFTVYRLTLRHVIRLSEVGYIMTDILFYY